MGRTPRMKLRGERANPLDWVERHCKSDSREVMLDAQLHNNRHIYHLLPWPYAKKILENRRLRLTPVDAWPDPYERWCCHQVFRTSNTVHGMQAYALCWTIGRYDEPYWRIAAFQRPFPIVRIRSSVSSIVDMGARSTSGRNGSLYLGKVLYRPATALEALGKTLYSETHTPHANSTATMLLHKRNAFRFEKEVRLLWLETDAPRDAFFIDIGPIGTITQVMISPYTEPTTARSMKSFVRNLGIECKQSAIMKELYME